MARESYAEWSKDDLVLEIKKLKKRKKYGIVWDQEKTKEKFEKDAEGKLPVLKEIKHEEIKTDRSRPINFLIEGDNYHALSVLNYTHKDAVDLIYIDPPYNTGAGDSFRYNDKNVDKEDAYRHSKWLSFMSKRLRLARKLLKKDGIIFISIDENEFAQLKLLCDEIFRESNLVAIHVWRKVVGGKSQGKISTQHEYILAYAKSELDLKIAKLPLPKHLLRKYRYEDERGKYDLRELGQGKGLSYSESLYYEIRAPDGTTIPKPPEGKGYRWSKKKWEWGLKVNPPYSVVKKVKGRWLPFAKQYLDYDNRGRKIERGVWPHTWLDNYGYTRTGTKDLDNVLGEGEFEHPKPVKLIKHLISLHPNKNAKVLDFFVGSGTTTQAVLELNYEDNGTRSFIVCTNNENNICTDVCYPRIKNILCGYNGFLDKKDYPGLKGNLKYFKTAFVEGEPTDMNKKKLVDQSTEMLCLKEDCFDEVLSGQHFKIFKNRDGKYLGIVYDDDGIEPLKKEVKRLDRKINVYVFSLDESAREEEFEDIIELVSTKPIPEVILNVYRRIFK